MKNITPITFSGSKSPVILVDGDKGGVGKSWTARWIAHLLRSVWSRTVIGFDGDPRNPHLARYYRNAFTVHQPYLREPEGWDEMIEKIEHTPDTTSILIDLPGNIGDAVAAQGRKFYAAMDALRRPVARVWMLDEEMDVVIQLTEALKIREADSRLIVIMNGRFGKPSVFQIWRDSKARSFILSANGAELYMPTLAPMARLRVNVQQRPFAQANQPIEIPDKIQNPEIKEEWLAKRVLTLPNRMDFEAYKNTIEKTFDSVRNRLTAPQLSEVSAISVFSQQSENFSITEAK